MYHIYDQYKAYPSISCQSHVRKSCYHIPDQSLIMANLQDPVTANLHNHFGLADLQNIKSVIYKNSLPTISHRENSIIIPEQISLE